MKKLMFDEVELKERLHGKNTFSRELDALKPVEDFLFEVLKEYPFVGYYDCNAGEPLKFWTLNYTSYSGFFMMHPLQYEMKAYQIQEALMSDLVEDYDYSGHFKDRITLGRANKYEDLNLVERNNYKSLVVLSGTNIFDQAICINKLRWIVEEEGKLAAIKPHPLMHEEHVVDLKKQILPNASILDVNDDMYSIMPLVETVYAPHSSESVLSAVCLDKKISPISPFKGRQLLSFYHINEVLFMAEKPKMVVNKIFSNYQSGLVHPEINKDWQDRIVRYVGYIDGLRNKFKDFYK
jgi:hypothetical protein